LIAKKSRQHIGVNFALIAGKAYKLMFLCRESRQTIGKVSL
jgi:hypothetical protein